MGKNIYESIKSDVKKSQKKLRKGVLKAASRNLPLHKRFIFNTSVFFENVGLRKLAKKTFELID